MTTFLMIIGAAMIGLGVGLMSSKSKKSNKTYKPKSKKHRKDDDFWDYAWS